MYKVKLENKGDSKYYVTSKDYKFTIDTEGSGITPLDTFLSGLGACVGVYTRYYSAKNPLPFKEFSVEVEAELTKAKPVHFDKINVTITPNGGALEESVRTKLIEFIKNCPAHNTLKNNPEIDIKIS
ncbi:MAG: OsmC family protein [Elusimicrobia bacterium]|nr:OsmC family protein [Candidatus Liberimonas magnetica]